MLDVIMIILGIALVVVFMVNLHLDLRCMMDGFKNNRPPIPPKPKQVLYPREDFYEIRLKEY